MGKIFGQFKMNLFNLSAILVSLAHECHYTIHHLDEVYGGTVPLGQGSFLSDEIGRGKWP